MTKDKSPFYPDQPVPVELFAGRTAQIERILKRGVGQVAAGKPVTMFIQGEYGIGKSSIAGFVQRHAETHYGLHSIYTSLGGAKNLDDVAFSILQATLRSGAFDPKKSEKMRHWLAKYIGKQDMFGISINLDALRKDAPNLSNPFGILEFLSVAKARLQEEGVKGIFLILDEINGISATPEFAHFIKGLVDTNALSREPLPLLLILCGVEERRREMIAQHEPVDRIFDVIDIEPMNQEELEDFFKRAFDSAQMEVTPEAMAYLVYFSAGFPKIMHLIGNNAYWTDKDGLIDEEDARQAIIFAADEVGKKYVDQQVYKALRSDDYHAILKKIAVLTPSVALSFKKSDVEATLTDTEKNKFHNFLQKMKKLNVLRSGSTQGEYIFNQRMVRLYLWLQSQKQEKNSKNTPVET